MACRARHHCHTVEGRSWAAIKSSRASLMPCPEATSHVCWCPLVLAVERSAELHPSDCLVQGMDGNKAESL